MIISTKDVVIDERTLKEKILSCISEEDIFTKYIPNFEVGMLINSPLREDKNPSFGIFWSDKYDKVMFKDYRIGVGDCFIFVSKLFNLSYIDTLKKIANDFNLQNYNVSYSKHQYNLEKRKKEKIILSIKAKDFSDLELSYWSQFGITKEILNLYNVYSVDKYYRNSYLRGWSSIHNPIFAYYFPRTNNLKIYRPFETEENKWRTNANNDWDIQGYDQLPEKGELLILTKSMKDVMCLNSLGYNAVATHAEGHLFNPDFFRHLSGRFKQIILFYDNDETGIKTAEKIAIMYNLKKIFIPKNDLEIKDISDYYKYYGKEETLKLLNDEIK